MHVLLTGASGFFGSVCVELLAQQQDLHLYILRSGERSAELLVNKEKAPTFVAPSSLSADDLATTLGHAPISHILHVGALASPEACEQEPQRAHTANVVFTEMLSNYANTVGAHLTTISTDLVFDGGRAPSHGFCEEDLPCPHSVYSNSKLAAEMATLCNSSHAVVRVALLYGEAPSQSKGFLGWMKRTFAEEKSLPLFEDEFRTPIHVLDAARAAFQIARSKARGIWHCGGPERLSRVQFGITVARAYGFDERLILPTTRLSHTSLPPRPEDVSLKSQALWREIQFTPKPVEEALREYEVGSRYSL
jgi:dTDP-4-dehydrorhamnose reductase